METLHKILLVDDDQDALVIYGEILKQLPSRPEIQTATSGARALALLETEPYHLLITDLKMPHMDGLQVISVVRRKYPNLRTVVLTAVVDEQFRSRIYALGVDLFWQKPTTKNELAMFQDCVAALIERQDAPGFRGVQSKSLVDIIQYECLSQSSSVLRITNGPLIGKIWINCGELFDAEAGNLSGEEAFQHILTWKAGSFEVLSHEPHHPNVIGQPYDALLLSGAQALDEARGQKDDGSSAIIRHSGKDPLREIDGLEFLVTFETGSKTPTEARGIENPERLVEWAQSLMNRFRELGDKLHAGPPDTVVGLGTRRHVGLTRQGDLEFCTGWQQTLSASEVRKATKKACALWAS